MNTVTLPKEFQERLTEQVKELVFNSLPDEVIQGLIKAEFDSFFESPTSPFQAVRTNGYGSNSESLQISCSPFRLLVWNTINRFLAPRLTAIVGDETSEFHQALNEWLKEVAKPNLSGDYKAFVHQLATANSEAALAAVSRAAAENVRTTINAAVSDLHLGVRSPPPQFTVYVPSLGINV